MRIPPPPTTVARLEVCADFGFASPNSAEDHLRALARKGAILMTAGAARGIRLPAPPGLPLIGAVAADSPLLAVENQRGTLPLAPELFSPRVDYLLQVRGNGPLTIEGLVVGLIRGGRRTP